MRLQGDRAGHEDPRGLSVVSHDKWCLLMTHNLACPKKRHYRCNLCGPAAAGEIPSSEQEALYARPIDGRPQSEVQVGPDKLEVVASFCYLGDMPSAGGGCEISVITW